MSMQPISPEPILRATTGFMAARLLGAAVELGVFDRLGSGSADQDELGRQIGVPPRRLHIVLDAMVSIGLLARQGKAYRCTPVAVAYLTDDAETDMRPFVRFMHRMRYESWLRLEEVVRVGTDAVEEKARSQEEQAIISEGIAAVTSPAARALADQYDFSQHQHLLDIGGGTGSFLRPALSRYPQLRSTLLDQAEVAEVARRRMGESGLSDRVSIQSGDFFTCQLPADADAVLLANVVHIFSPERNRELLGRLRASAAAGSRLLLVDFWTDASHAEPAFAAIMAGEFLLASGEGAVYSVDEISGWLRETHWSVLEHVGLAGPASLVVAEAV